ncbi:MAG: hypothetical protein ACI9JN_000230 [Bacteroidia bacterium]|jgi:hypothetical protein
MKLSKSSFKTDVCASNDALAKLEEWIDFDWDDEIGPYVIMTHIGEYIINNWSKEKQELRNPILVIRDYLINGDEEIRNLLYTDFYPELVNCNDVKVQTEILELLGQKGIEMFKEAKESFYRQE